MDSKSKAALYGLTFLVICELVLRWASPALPDPSERWVPEGRSVSFVLGTSRTMRAVHPLVVERTLHDSGFLNAWIANVSRKGATTVGLYRLYMDTVHPIAPSIPDRGIVAFEVRGVGMNDTNLEARERKHLGSGLGGVSWMTRLGTAGLDGLAHRLLGLSAIVRARDWPLRGAPAREAGHAAPSWAVGERGWVPFDEPRHEDLRERVLRDRYRSQLLREFHLGGIQTEYLGRLVEQIRRDGFYPVAYLLPVTDAHRGFYDAGQYDSVIRHISAIAGREKFVFVDLDSDHRLPRSAFQDTHHLTPETALPFGRTFAERVVLPHLPVGSQ